MNEIAEILATTARLEALAEGHDRRLVELREVTTTRLDAHSIDIRSLNKTRDRQYGAVKVVGGLATVVAAVAGWFRYG